MVGLHEHEFSLVSPSLHMGVLNLNLVVLHAVDELRGSVDVMSVGLLLLSDVLDGLECVLVGSQEARGLRKLLS